MLIYVKVNYIVFNGNKIRSDFICPPRKINFKKCITHEVYSE